MIENASDMIQSCRPDGSFEFVNRAWLEKLGYTAEEVEGLTVWDIIDLESLPHCQVCSCGLSKAKRSRMLAPHF